MSAKEMTTARIICGAHSGLALWVRDICMYTVQALISVTVTPPLFISKHTRPRLHSSYAVAVRCATPFARTSRSRVLSAPGIYWKPDATNSNGATPNGE